MILLKMCPDISKSEVYKTMIQRYGNHLYIKDYFSKTYYLWKSFKNTTKCKKWVEKNTQKFKLFKFNFNLFLSPLSVNYLRR